jgi:hypothetical protein
VSLSIRPASTAMAACRPNMLGWVGLHGGGSFCSADARWQSRTLACTANTDLDSWHVSALQTAAQPRWVATCLPKISHRQSQTAPFVHSLCESVQDTAQHVGFLTEATQGCACCCWLPQKMVTWCTVSSDSPFYGGVCYMDIFAKQQWHCPPGSSRVNLISCDHPRWFAPPTPG